MPNRDRHSCTPAKDAQEHQQSSKDVFTGDSGLRMLIDTFGSRRALAAHLRDPKIAHGQCEAVSAAFLFFLQKNGVKADLIRCWNAHDDHVVVRIGETVVDWTLRQFDSQADVPTLFASPRDQMWPEYSTWTMSERFIRAHQRGTDLIILPEARGSVRSV